MSLPRFMERLIYRNPSVPCQVHVRRLRAIVDGPWPWDGVELTNVLERGEDYFNRAGL